MTSSLTVTKRAVEKTLRVVGLERVLYHWVYHRDHHRSRRDNAHFFATHHLPCIPPPRLRFDVIGATDARAYNALGQEDARHVRRELSRWFPGQERICVLEWGCGPGRILSHLRLTDPAQRLELHGSDYYAPSIHWARRNLPGIAFAQNRIDPPLPHAAGQFDFVYAISVFTHLSEASHAQWLREILRVLRPGGVFLCTTHGDAFRDKLGAKQQKDYDAGRYAFNLSYVNGSQMFAAFQSPPFMKRMLAGLDILEHTPSGWARQDVWIVRKSGGHRPPV